MEIIKMKEDIALSDGVAVFGAIDVGSNAMRLGLATYDESGTPQLIQRYRESVRLGKDAFTSGVLSQHTMDDAVEAFRAFRDVLDQYHVEHYRAVATSAMRDAVNGEELVQRIQTETGIKLRLISGDEEARLVHYSIMRRVDLQDQWAVLIDMGGGSVEVTLCRDAKVVSSQSLNIGTVRLLNMLGEGGDFQTLLFEYLDGVREKIRKQIGKRKVKVCVATGGNASAIGSLGCQLLGLDDAQHISRKHLKKLIAAISEVDFESRVKDLGMRPDRADVIIPASMVFHEIMRLSGAKEMLMPDAGLLDGIVLDMLDSDEQTFDAKRRNLLALARTLGKRFRVNRKHCKCVSRLALSLFDQTKGLHQLGLRERLLLEIAALLHEIGMYLHVGGYHRHGAYLISVSPLLGLNEQDQKLLAQLVHYHRKSPPAKDHTTFASLDTSSQQQVWMLSALLRVAIACNKERRQRVEHVDVSMENDALHLELHGHGDMLLERWAILKNNDYFKQAFGLELHIDFQ